MGAFDFNFEIPAGERYAPSPERVQAWQRLLPPANFGFAPPVTDRTAWSRWQDDPFGQRVLDRARELVAEGYPDYNDAAYIDCLDTEEVTRINQILPLVRERHVTGNHLTLVDGPVTLQADVTIEGADLEVGHDTINQPPHPIRVALRCARPVRTATVSVVFHP